jgi:tRNA modification GTPase
MHDVDTIAALSTPPGIGGIGVIRISGPAVLPIVQRVFVRTGRQSLPPLESHRMYHGFVVDSAGERIDEALLCVMRQPRSYTREDVAEISCHGGILTTQRVLDAVLAHGARIAEPGEFTRRAFLNGRLDLVQAEAVIDLINARTVASQRAAFRQLSGALSQHLHTVREPLLQVSVHLEAGIDFPDEELELLAAGGLVERLQKVADSLTRLLATFDRGRVMREGLAIAIIGRPNVGKSSLLNALLGRDRAIVSAIPGTTRDTIEAALDIDGLLLRIVDTAGIRVTSEALEQEGVQRARAAMSQADMLLVVLDGSALLTADDYALLMETAAFRRIVVQNKCDLPARWSTDDLGVSVSNAPLVTVSALCNQGLQALEQTIVRQVLGSASLAQDEVLLTRARHRHSVEQALYNVQSAVQGLQQSLPVEFVAFEVTEALRHLGQVLGEDYAGEVLERIFSSFCIGK